MKAPASLEEPLSFLEKIFISPWRVYLCLGLLAVVGIVCGLKLPISLFPHSSKPSANISFDTGSMTGEEFLKNYGSMLEGQLMNLSGDKFEVDTVESTYGAQNVNITVNFKWGNSPTDSFNETERVVNAFASRLPQEIRDRVGTWQGGDNSGFLAVSFYSETRSPTEVYNQIEPLIMNQISQVKEANWPGLYNPASQEVRIELRPEALATLKLLPNDIATQIRLGLQGYAAGSFRIGKKKISVQVPKLIDSFESLQKFNVATSQGGSVPLARIADINLGPDSNSARVFKTSGFTSLILFASPKPNGNIKKMSEDILDIIRHTEPQFPRDIHYKILVDPSEFIRNAIDNVLHEVTIAALLAVVVLFFFIGSFKNVGTAAIEIPLSMVLAFIFMKLFGVNLNLISLGGLALSAGMNVDASVVVMENIFRHFEHLPEKLSYRERLRIISSAVNEVKAPLIISTLSSLIVFAPLIFTSDLSYAILGDLAKAIVFSHGCSALIALVLVPTIRLHIMSRESKTRPLKSPVEKQLAKMESFYLAKLKWALGSAKFKRLFIPAIFGLTILSVCLIAPRLKKEIIGTPDTDWIYMSVDTQGNLQIQQMVSSADEIEARLLKEYGDKISYTFNQIQNANHASIMARLKDKREMMVIWKSIEKAFPNTPFLKFYVFPWNPSEFNIPDPPQLLADIRGGEREDRTAMGRDLKDILEEKQIYSRTYTTPDLDRALNLNLIPHLDVLSKPKNSGLLFSSLANLPFIATSPQNVDYLNIKGQQTPIVLEFPRNFIRSESDLSAIPVGLGSTIVPLKALFSAETKEAPAPIFRRNLREEVELKGRLDQENLPQKAELNRQAKILVEDWTQKNIKSRKEKSSLNLTFEDPDVDLNTAISQLTTAVLLSMSLIFLILLLQFGNIAYALMIMVAVPLGILGAALSLFVFRSTLSLNSILGVILLNGIAVANSILLVDFTHQLYLEGKSATEAALEAAHKRLRPILITSLTTILGMLPIAFGFGEGGRVLQPLGITVSGGLWVSMIFTLFIVPVLQVSYLDAQKAKKSKKAGQNV